MATNNFAPRMVELKISTQAPNSTPNPSEDHEADGLCLAKIGLEPVSIINRIMIDLDTLPRSTVVQPETLPLETKVVRTPQSGSPINHPRCDGQVDAASDDDEQLCGLGVGKEKWRSELLGRVADGI